ncbi:hypothetical protein GTHT12_03746 (plasmid) [Geobacillus thermodenitrificans]|nr:hypothetical protein GTHT12_03746 [Geobacillus thermodenitrificans]
MHFNSTFLVASTYIFGVYLVHFWCYAYTFGVHLVHFWLFQRTFLVLRVHFWCLYSTDEIKCTLYELIRTFLVLM